MSREQIEERIELSDIIDYALRDWDDYIYECQEEGNSPIDTFEEWIADAVLKNGYRKQEWISVDERLPERSGRYLTHCHIGGESLVCILYYNKFNGFDEGAVTHWTPLPEAPKMKGGAECT